jgi:hypothetical protein
MQYSLRSVPPRLDAALRARAKAEGKSLNTVVLEALVRGVGLGPESVRQRDLSGIVGTWVDDPALDEALAEQRTVDVSDWR